MSDIKLADRDVVLEGHRVNCVAVDLVLDSPGRRRPRSSGMRRAVVHDFDDGLTINWKEDYPGGVTIEGPVSLPGGVEDVRVGSLSLRLHRPRLQTFVTRGGRPSLEFDPTVPEPELETRQVHEIDVAAELEWLRSQVNELGRRVAELERDEA